MSSMRIGYGYDVHKLVPNRKLILGGVEISYELGLDGHSDADVLLHAITDALLGALALGDIGTHFPDTDPKYKNVDSRILLRDAYKLIQSKGYALGNLDATVVAQEPKLKPYILQIRELISLDLNTAIENVSIKATTSEWLGFEGRKEGISSSAVVLLSKVD
ncbi:MAG: 2-C-methyl-D-erythritol 2,4-cyclodiphosphate synthase [Balneola sp.]|jgi:2-C-methyl-D-erythritol 2,4-cyclodiphosphate synthase